jgi:hypothetical protein
MNKPLILIGVLLCVAALFLLGGAVGASPSPMVEQDGHWVEQYARTAAIVGSGLALAGGFALIGIGSGRWRRPVPVRDRRSEGLQE